MSSSTSDGPNPPATPIFDETVEATAFRAPADDDLRGSDDETSGRGATADRAKETARETADVAKDQAGQVAGTAKDAGARVAGTTKEQASRVAGDAADQARQLYGQATSALSDQAGKQQSRAASTLRTLSDDLGSLQRGEGGGDGLAGELVDAISSRADRLGRWLDAREPADVLDEVKQFAARRPGLFIGIAAVAGVVAARATKALTADAAGSGTGTGTGTGSSGSSSSGSSGSGSGSGSGTSVTGTSITVPGTDGGTR